MNEKKGNVSQQRLQPKDQPEWKKKKIQDFPPLESTIIIACTLMYVCVYVFVYLYEGTTLMEATSSEMDQPASALTHNTNICKCMRASVYVYQCKVDSNCMR